MSDRLAAYFHSEMISSSMFNGIDSQRWCSTLYYNLRAFELLLDNCHFRVAQAAGNYRSAWAFHVLYEETVTGPDRIQYPLSLYMWRLLSLFPLQQLSLPAFIDDLVYPLKISFWPSQFPLQHASSPLRMQERLRLLPPSQSDAPKPPPKHHILRISMPWTARRRDWDAGRYLR